MELGWLRSENCKGLDCIDQVYGRGGYKGRKRVILEASISMIFKMYD